MTKWVSSRNESLSVSNMAQAMAGRGRLTVKRHGLLNVGGEACRGTAATTLAVWWLRHTRRWNINAGPKADYCRLNKVRKLAARFSQSNFENSQSNRTWARTDEGMSEAESGVKGLRHPIFVGGTGRSGTSIMATMLTSHPDLVRAQHETKIVVEVFGLRDLINELSDGFDLKRNHRTIENFKWWANVLSRRGSRSNALRLLSAITTGGGVRRSIPIARFFPNAQFTLHSPGEAFGTAHWDECVERLLSRIVAFTDTEGIIDTEGVIRPFFTAKLFDRSELLDAARTFLDELYSPILRKYDGYRWCDDTPLNASRASFLAELYPQMRLIHMVRDPRDVVASYRDQLWASDLLNVKCFVFPRCTKPYSQKKRGSPPSIFFAFASRIWLITTRRPGIVYANI